MAREWKPASIFATADPFLRPAPANCGGQEKARDSVRDDTRHDSES